MNIKKYRDLWLFSYLCNGMNVSDILRLKYSDFENMERFSFVRKKTDHNPNENRIVVELHKEAINIIERWGNNFNHNNHVFDFLNNEMSEKQKQSAIKTAIKRCNQYMNQIAEDLRISFKISTYYARHTWATVQMEAGADILFISKSLGHADIRTTQDYLGTLGFKARIQGNKNLL